MSTLTRGRMGNTRHRKQEIGQTNRLRTVERDYMLQQQPQAGILAETACWWIGGKPNNAADVMWVLGGIFAWVTASWMVRGATTSLCPT